MKRRFFLFKISLIITALVFEMAVSAQGTSITKIPLRSKAYTMVTSPDTRLIATSELGVIHQDEVFTQYLPIHIFDSENGEELFTLEGHTDYALSLSFNTDASVLASYHPNGWIYLWDTATGAVLREIRAIPDMGTIRFIPNSHLLVQAAISSLIPTILVWNTDTGAVESVLLDRSVSRAEARNSREENRHLPNNIVDMLVMPDGEIVITTTAMNDILAWNLSSGQRDPLLYNEDNRLPYFDLRTVALAEDGDTLIYANAREGIVYLQSVTEGTITPIYVGALPASAVATAVEADVIAWLGGERSAPVIFISSTADPTAITEIPLFSDATLPTSLVFSPATATLTVSPDGSRIIVGGFVNTDDAENAILVIENG